MSKVLFASTYLARTSVILRLEAEESPIAKTALCRWEILRFAQNDKGAKSTLWERRSFGWKPKDDRNGQKGPK